jgi:hypothetical protein
MKKLCLLLSLLIISPSTSLAGSFYNPDPEELRKKGQEAAEKLNELFVNFYEMLKNIEGNRFGHARENKDAFDTKLRKEALPLFIEISQEAPDKRLRFKLTPELERSLNYIKNEYYKSQEIDTQKKLAELPVTMIGRLLQESERFKIQPEENDFFPELRSLIMTAIDVQWVGLKVSELWTSAVY